MRAAAVALLVQCVGCAYAELSSKRAWAAKPVMGWSTWVALGKAATHDDVVANANLLQSSGLFSAGYAMIQIDDGWQQLYGGNWIVRQYFPQPPSSKKVSKGGGVFWPPPPPAGVNPGCIVADPVKYPQGMAGLSAIVHGMGFRFGLYTSGTDSQCSSTAVHPVYLSGRYTAQDATCFVDMGIDMIKVDNCNWQYDALRNRPASRMEAWRAALPQNISLYDCHFGCLAATCSKWVTCPWSVTPARNAHLEAWCSATVDLARTTNDIEPTWNSVLRNANSLWGRGTVSRPGFWSDPDYLVPREAPVMTAGQRRAQFSLWCITSSPLLISTDLRTLSADTLAMLGNADAIRVDQTYAAGDAGDRIAVDATRGLWVYKKSLGGGETAVLIVHVGAQSGVPKALGGNAPGVQQTYALPMSTFHASACMVKNVWTTQSRRLNATSNAFVVQPADCVFLLVSQCA